MTDINETIRMAEDGARLLDLYGQVDCAAAIRELVALAGAGGVK